MGRLIRIGGAGGGGGLVGDASRVDDIMADEMSVAVGRAGSVGDNSTVGEAAALVGVGRGVEVARVGVGMTGVAVGVGGKVLVGVAVGDGVEVKVGLRVEEAVGTAAALSATTMPMPTCIPTTSNNMGATNQKRKRVRIIAFTTGPC